MTQGFEELVPDRRISIDGTAASPDLQGRITRIVVELCDDVFNEATVILTDPDRKLSGGNQFQPGTQLLIELGFVGKLKPVFDGEVVSVEPRFVRDKPASYVVRAMERLHRLALAPKTRAYNNADAAAIVNKVAHERGLSGQAPAGSKDYYLQANQSDYSFLRKVAGRTGNHLFLDGKKLVIGPAPKLGEIEVGPDSGLKKLRVKMKATDQAAKVIVRGWNQKDKKAIVGQASASGELADGAKEAKPFARGDFFIEGPAIADTKEAEAIAKATAEAIAERFVTCEGELGGNADLVPGRVLSFDKFGELLDGKYRLQTCRHEFDKRGYKVLFDGTRVAKKKGVAKFKAPAEKPSAEQKKEKAAKEKKEREEKKQRLQEKATGTKAKPADPKKGPAANTAPKKAEEKKQEQTKSDPTKSYEVEISVLLPHGEVGSLNDSYTLTSSDKSYSQTKSVKSDGKKSSNGVSFTFTELKPDLAYTLKVGGDHDYTLFEELAWSDLGAKAVEKKDDKAGAKK